MTTMADVRTAFKVAVVLASDLSADAICWGNAEGIVADPLIKLFQTVSVECTPWEESLAGTGAQKVRSLSQWRQITFQVRVETVNGCLAYDASDLAQETLLGLHRLEARAALAAAGSGVLVDLKSDIRSMPYRSADHRVVHSWAFDAIVRARLTTTDPSTVGIIETVEASGDMLEAPSTHIITELIAP